jgi:hypothetical protein
VAPRPHGQNCVLRPSPRGAIAPLVAFGRYLHILSRRTGTTYEPTPKTGAKRMDAKHFAGRLPPSRATSLLASRSDCPALVSWRAEIAAIKGPQDGANQPEHAKCIFSAAYVRCGGSRAAVEGVPVYRTPLFLPSERISERGKQSSRLLPLSLMARRQFDRAGLRGGMTNLFSRSHSANTLVAECELRPRA